MFYQEENKRQVLTYERTIQKLHQEIEISRADEEHNHRNIVKVLPDANDRNLIFSNLEIMIFCI